MTRTTTPGSNKVDNHRKRNKTRKKQQDGTQQQKHKSCHHCGNKKDRKAAHQEGEKYKKLMLANIQQLQSSFTNLHQEMRQITFNHQLLVGKYDAEISKLSLQVQTLAVKQRANNRRVKDVMGLLEAKESTPGTVTPELVTRTSGTPQVPETPPPQPANNETPSASSNKKKEARKRKKQRASEDPVECPVCKKVYKRKYNLEVHQTITKHGLDNSISEFLNSSSLPQQDLFTTVFEDSQTENSETNSSQHPKSSKGSKDPVPEVPTPLSPEANNTNDPAVKNGPEDPQPEKRPRSSKKLTKKPEEKRSEVASEIVLSSDSEEEPEIKQEKNTCPSCELSFDTEALLTEHIQKSCKKFLPCKICGKKFFKQRSLNLHLKNHPTGILFKCPTCSKSFTSASNLQVHKELHLNERPFGCLQCGKRFRKQNNLESHTKTSHENALKFFCCTLCPKSFVSEVFLEKHSRTHPSCKQCHQSFRNTVLLGQHIRTCVVNTLRRCDYCPKELPQEEWKEHLKKCQVKKTQSVVCFYCQLKFLTMTCLKRHVKSKHEGLPCKKA